MFEKKYKLKWDGYVHPYDYIRSAQYTVTRHWREKVEELEKKLKHNHMKTIKTDTHLLLVDETEIKANTTGTYISMVDDESYLDIETLTPNKFTQEEIDEHLLFEDCYLILAASPKIDGIPEFETLPSNTEDDVEKLANDLMKKYIHPAREKEDDVLWSSIKDAIIEGYKQAKSETMFSLEDVKKAWKSGYNENNLDNYIQSRTKPKEYEFVPEMEEIHDEDCPTGILRYKQPKISNNKIQGTWKQI